MPVFQTPAEMVDEIMRLRKVMQHWADRADTTPAMAVTLTSTEIRKEIQP